VLHNKENKVRAFRLPKDSEEHKRWLTAIPRDNIPDTNNTVVCERHRSENLIFYAVRL